MENGFRNDEIGRTFLCTQFHGCATREKMRVGFFLFFSNTRRQKRSSAPSPVFSLRLLLFTLETLPTLKNVFSFFRVCVCVYLFGHWVVREARQIKTTGWTEKKKEGMSLVTGSQTQMTSSRRTRAWKKCKRTRGSNSALQTRVPITSCTRLCKKETIEAESSDNIGKTHTKKRPTRKGGKEGFLISELMIGYVTKWWAIPAYPPFCLTLFAVVYRQRQMSCS